MIDYDLLSIKEKLDDGLNVKTDLIGSVFDRATIDTINRMNYSPIIISSDKSGADSAE